MSIHDDDSNDEERKQVKVNGVPINDAPQSSNPEPRINKTAEKRKKHEDSSSDSSTKDVAYDVLPADLEANADR